MLTQHREGQEAFTIFIPKILLDK